MLSTSPNQSNSPLENSQSSLLTPTSSQILNSKSTTTSKRRNSSSNSHKTIAFIPSLNSKNDNNGSNGSNGSNLSITCSRRNVRTSAVSFSQSGLIHTQLISNSNDLTNSEEESIPTILIRITDLNPIAPNLILNEVIKALWNSLFCYFSNGKDSFNSVKIELPLPSHHLHSSLLFLGALIESPYYILTRSSIFQLFNYSNSNNSTSLPFPVNLITAKNTQTGNQFQYPLRKPKPTSNSLNPLYSRIIPHLDNIQYLNLNACTMNDVNILHKWLNDERVDKFWQESGTWEAHEKFLHERIADPHVLSVIGSYVQTKEGEITSDTPAVYSEIYWVKEDRLGQYLGEDKVGNFDRGIHVLVGASNHRGPHKVRAWLPSLIHYCFLDELRTERILVEPNELNEKMLMYFESVGFKRQGSVVFPHKIAALMVLEKEDFYNLCPF